MTKLVIVESPTKGKTISKFLGSDFKVESSFGHIRDLPQTAADIPAKYKKESWSNLGVNIEKNFEPIYVVPKDKKKVIKKLKELVAQADELYLATDEDREGESISWHLTQLLEPKIPIKRMVFHEITKTAIEQALQNPRAIDEKLVQAQETRRILDRLVGYTVSPLLWKKIAFGLSAGRVQSAGLRMLVERERERIKFKSAEYWDVLARLKKDEKEFEARLTRHEGERVATGKDFNDKGELQSKSPVAVLKKKDVEDLAKKLKQADWKVVSVEEKQSITNPAAPFTTSTLQQEGNRKLGMSTKQTMRTAQYLYENGFITYMRTDSPALSEQAVLGAREIVQNEYGQEYLSDKARNYTAKSKSAQEAHEAIRPAHRKFIKPVNSGLSGNELALYDLIWKRTVATQMRPAKKVSMNVEIETLDSSFTAAGTRIAFAGFLQVYLDKNAATKVGPLAQEIILPDMKKGDMVQPAGLQPQPHETKPPARYNEASLVARLEKEGIGRPSTYASIISTLLDRGYARRVGSALVPTFTGFAVVQILEKHFHDLVDYEFTSQMEQSLDEIAGGKKDWLPYLKQFYLGPKGLEQQVKEKETEVDPEESRTIIMPNLENKDVQVKVGRFGPYLVKTSDKNIRTSIPEDVTPEELTREAARELIEASENGPKSIGNHPDTGQAIYCLVGRFGPYVQLGEATKGEKPKRASLPKGMSPSELDLKLAIKLLSLPRDLGKHPETNKEIRAGIGRFGPYIVHDGDFRSLKKEDDVYEITLERALELLAEEKKGRGKNQKLKDLGEHPADKKPVVIYNGRYGPYVKHGKKNVSLPKDTDPEKFTLEEAVKLIAEKKKK